MWRSWKIGRPVVVVAMLCAVTVGCTSIRTSGIDPSGEQVFVTPPPVNGYPNAPNGPLPWEDVAVQLRPQELVAPVGSEVVLVAGVCAADGYMRTNRRLEWTIAPGSVGQFVAVAPGSAIDFLLGDFNSPRKINATRAIGSTGRTDVQLNRGACAGGDSVLVRRGEGWVSLTSSVEGTSNVMVVAPEVYCEQNRLKAAMVHWVDVRPQYPPPSINPAGSRHVLTTTVTRYSAPSPREGWRVRYEITEGPPAGFAPDGVQVTEVTTNAAGQASVEIFQKQPAHGTNKVSIQVIRPANMPGACGRELVVGRGTTTKTWTAPDLSIQATGPATVSVGATATYRMTVNNPGDLTSRDVVVTTSPPDGLTYISSNPPAEIAGRQLRWRFGELGARQQRTIEVSFRAERPGSVSNCCEVTAAGGLRATGCVATTITAMGSPLPSAAPSTGASPIEIQITRPAQDTVAVGSRITFQIALRNRGPTTATGLRIIDRFDPGLEHRQSEGRQVIDRRLDDLPAGASRRLAVEFRVTKSGRLCHVVEVTGAGIAPARREACIMAVGAAVSPAPGQTPITPKPASPIAVNVTGQKQLVVGETARFVVEVTNQGTTTLRNVKVVDHSDSALEPNMATDGYRIENGALVWIIDSLAAGDSNRFEIQCKCAMTIAKACNRASATPPDGLQATGEACIEIRSSAPPPKPTVPATPAEAGIVISVSGPSRSVRAGKGTGYEIVVRNQGTTAQRLVGLTAIVPDGMTPDPLGTFGPTTVKINRQMVRFDPVAQLSAGESLEYHIRILARQPGMKKFRVELTLPGTTAPLVEEASMEVIAP